MDKLIDGAMDEFIHRENRAYTKNAGGNDGQRTRQCSGSYWQRRGESRVSIA